MTLLEFVIFSNIPASLSSSSSSSSSFFIQTERDESFLGDLRTTRSLFFFFIFSLFFFYSLFFYPDSQFS